MNNEKRLKNLAIKIWQDRLRNKDRFCKIIATVALLDASIESDWLQTKKIPSTGKSKQTQPQKLLRSQQDKLSPCACER